jgi:uncharacterized membrane protein YbaN (DUF454 family)
LSRAASTGVKERPFPGDGIVRHDARFRESVRSEIVRHVLITAGTLFLILGIVGVFLPVLPTTPFLLLAAACYARGSSRFYSWLMNNRLFGTYIRNYREGRGLPPRVKVIVIILLWVTIGYSAAFAVHVLWARVILILIAVGVTTHILYIRTLRHQDVDPP